jgi:2,3-bisphosphoglycerate-independent phosphoglycerate mutase
MPSEGGAEKWVLPAHDKLPKGKKLMLIILDGWGEQIADQFNAIAVAKTPIMDHLKTVRNKDFPLLSAHPPFFFHHLPVCFQF